MSMSWVDDQAANLHSHGELIVKLVQAREFEEATLGPKARVLSAISEKNLRLLIDFAFYTSMASEEGRYPRFRIAFRKATEGLAVRFTAMLLSQIDDLRKLAPICGPDCALVV